MAASSLVDLVSIQINSGGTGNLALGQAVAGFRGREALSDGATYSYSIQQGSEYEVGTFVYLLSTASAVRTVLNSSNGGAPINAKSGATLTVTVLSKDLIATVGSVAALVAALASTSGAASIGTADDETVQDVLDGIKASITSLLAGGLAWALPDEANGDPIPASGSGLPYLSGGVMKIA